MKKHDLNNKKYRKEKLIASLVEIFKKVIKMKNIIKNKNENYICFLGASN